MGYRSKWVDLLYNNNNNNTNIYINQKRFAESSTMAKAISQIENLSGGSVQQRAVVRLVNFQVPYSRPATAPVKVYLILIGLDENESDCYGRVYDFGTRGIFGFYYFNQRYTILCYNMHYIRAQFWNSTKTRSLYYNNSYLTIPHEFQSR